MSFLFLHTCTLLRGVPLDMWTICSKRVKTGLWSSDQEKVFTFTFLGCTSGSALWLGPHDRIMRLWIHGGCTMNPQPHDPIMRLWIHGTQGIGPGTRHWPRTASPHGRTMRLWIHGGCTMNPQPHDPIMRGDGPASPQCCTVLYCTGSWIKDQGSRTLDLVLA